MFIFLNAAKNRGQEKVMQQKPKNRSSRLSVMFLSVSQKAVETICHVYRMFLANSPLASVGLGLQSVLILPLTKMLSTI